MHSFKLYPWQKNHPNRQLRRMKTNRANWRSHVVIEPSSMDYHAIAETITKIDLCPIKLFHNTHQILLELVLLSIIGLVVSISMGNILAALLCCMVLLAAILAIACFNYLEKMKSMRLDNELYAAQQPMERSYAVNKAEHDLPLPIDAYEDRLEPVSLVGAGFKPGFFDSASSVAPLKVDLSKDSHVPQITDVLSA